MTILAGLLTWMDLSVPLAVFIGRVLRRRREADMTRDMKSGFY